MLENFDQRLHAPELGPCACSHRFRITTGAASASRFGRIYFHESFSNKTRNSGARTITRRKQTVPCREDSENRLTPK